ncbi:hypothetical protein GQ457_04G021610 [Hibiscus cannabinus]
MRKEDDLEYKQQLLEVFCLCNFGIYSLLDSLQSLHSNSREECVKRNIYLFDIERVKLTKRVNTVHVRDQKHELTPPRDRNGTLRQRIARGDSSTVEGTVYKQAE